LLVQLKVAKPDPLSPSSRSALPSPESVPPLQVTVSVAVPTVLKVQLGADPCKKCGLAATAAVVAKPATAKAAAKNAVRRRTCVLL
jgi:hypothetical protein